MNGNLLADDVRSYLRRLGGTQETEGRGGSLWTIRGRHVGVASEIELGSVEWRSVIDRLGAAISKPAAEVEREVQTQFVDVARLRAAKDVVIEGSIPLDAGVKLVTSARTMLRASATTAQKLRPQISGSYSVTGDKLAQEARLGHTIHGSYIIPILMPLPRYQDTPRGRVPFEGMEIHQVSYEPAQRRVMRTLAEALSAVEQVVVRPGKMPQAKDANEIVAAGVSRELVNALIEVVDSPSVASFTADFDWASSAMPPKVDSGTVEIPHDASELLTATAKLLKSSNPQVQQSVTGPIVEVRHVPRDPFGEVAIQTIRNGRPAEVRVRIREPEVADCLEWMRSARTVLVDGRIRRSPGRPLLIEQPLRLLPVDLTYLHP